MAEKESTPTAPPATRAQRAPQTREFHDYARAIVETVREPLLVLDADLRVKAANRSFYQTFQVSKEETENKFLYELDGQWNIPRLRALLGAILAKNTRFQDFEVDYECPRIGRKTMLLNARRICREDNRTPMILLVTEDITKRKQLEHELMASEVRYRRLFETAKDGILLVDADTGQITDVNPFLVQLLGYSRDELLEKNLWEIGPFKDREVSQPAFRQLQEKEYIRHEDLPLKTKDGRRVAVEFVSNVYRVGSQKVIQYNIRDITERKRAEDEIQKLNRALEQRVLELIAANKELEAFNYSASHDLRTPLVTIAGFSRLMLSDYSDKLDADGRQALNIIRANVQKMGQLIDDLLAFSRLGHQTVAPSDIDMDELAKATFDELKFNVPERRLQLNVKTLPRARGDRAMIRQVFINLLSNAIKFTRHKETRVIEVGGWIEAEQNIYYVKDNGAGFDRRYANKLFGLFQRLHTDKEFEGTGVGLAIVERIIRRHGGRVWAEGEINKGATFYVTIPNEGG